MVEKGAAAYKLRSTTSRTVKTCSTTFASCSSLVNFDSTVATQSALGAASATERDELISWAKGLDMNDWDSDGVKTTEMDADAHGDVVHSRPVALNYGTDSTPEVVVYYGDNRGVLHAINGNRDGGNNIGSIGPGGELWSFIPPEFIGKLKRLRDNEPLINYMDAETGLPSTGEPKPYATDGPLSAFKGQIGGADKVFIYSSMRRGGRALYAFDVTTPTSPALKWKKGCPNNFSSFGVVSDTDCTAGFTGLGQTWSSPKIVSATSFL